MPATPLWSRQLGLTHPIVQAPMAGGATTPELVSAVSASGALGTLAAALLGPSAIARQIADIRTRTDRPFGVNLFVLPSPFPDPEPAVVEQALSWLAPHYATFGLPLPDVHAPGWRWCEDFQAQLEAVAEAAPACVSFTFGIVDRATVARLQARGSLVLGTATTVAEAQAWEAAGADAVTAQGSEAGAHRGTFLEPAERSLIGTLPLVRACVQAVSIPVIAAGGIMDGAGIAAVQALGAQAAQMGTAFLVCDEARIPEPHRLALLAARGGTAATRITRAFSGREARGIVNTYMQAMQPLEARLPPYPILNALTGPLRKAAAEAGDAQYLSLWAGQGVPLARPLPAAQLIERLVAELQQTRERLA